MHLVEGTQNKEEIERKFILIIWQPHKINAVCFFCFVLFSPAISTAVKDSWKFAAVEICELIHQVRDSGMEDVNFLEGKINNLLASMHEQSEVIEKLNNELQMKKQVRCTIPRLESDIDCCDEWIRSWSLRLWLPPSSSASSFLWYDN